VWRWDSGVPVVAGPAGFDNIPGFIELQKRYGAQGFTMIGISMDDSPEPVVDFYKELPDELTLHGRPTDRLGSLYGGIPDSHTFLIGATDRTTPSNVWRHDPTNL